VNRLARLLPVIVVAAVLIVSAAAPASNATSTPAATVWVDVAAGQAKNPAHLNDPHLPCVALALYGNGFSRGTGYGYGYGGGISGTYAVLDSNLHLNRSGQWSYGAQGGDQKLATMGTFKTGHFLWGLASSDLSVIKTGTFQLAGC
jgi:hypothetical protein